MWAIKRIKHKFKLIVGRTGYTADCLILYTFFTEKVETKGRKVFFEDPQTASSQPRIPYDGVPSVITGKRVYDCHQGIDRHAADKRRLKSNKVCTFVAAHFRSLTSIVFTNSLAVVVLYMPSKQEEVIKQILFFNEPPCLLQRGFTSLSIYVPCYKYWLWISGDLKFSFIHVGRFTRYNFMVCDMLPTSLGHESFHVNKT